jgi:chromosome segregation ATPase
MEGNLDKAKAESKAQADADAAALAQRDQRITDLESQNQDLDKAAAQLRGSLTNLQTRISSTEDELAQAKGDRTLLLSELKQLQAKKDDLEEMFNDLTFLRTRVRELRAELTLSRELDWIRRGVYASFKEKGGERLIHPLNILPPSTNLGLNVIIKQNGETEILAAPPTNSPAK